MEFLPVTLYGCPILRKKCVDIDRDYEGLDSLISDMFYTMKKSGGIGLSGPQVNLDLNIFVVDTSYHYGDGSYRKVFINPEIVEKFGENVYMREGCLSIPNIYADVYRPDKIKIKYYDMDWNLHEDEYDSIMSRVVQHEYDHLNGILFTDKINSLVKTTIKSKLKNISKGKISTGYKTIKC